MADNGKKIKMGLRISDNGKKNKKKFDDQSKNPDPLITDLGFYLSISCLSNLGLLVSFPQFQLEPNSQMCIYFPLIYPKI